MLETQPQAGGRAKEYRRTHETGVQYLTACESKESKRDQVRERSRYGGGAGRF